MSVVEPHSKNIRSTSQNRPVSIQEEGSVSSPDSDPDAVLAPAEWTGKPVVCTTCQNAGKPVMGQDGWQLPIHGMLERTFPFRIVTCPGSMGPVTAMQTPAPMEQRIEEHVAQAMPERVNDDWSTP